MVPLGDAVLFSVFVAAFDEAASQARTHRAEVEQLFKLRRAGKIDERFFRAMLATEARLASVAITQRFDALQREAAPSTEPSLAEMLEPGSAG